MTHQCAKNSFSKLPSNTVSLMALLPLAIVFIATQSFLIIAAGAISGAQKIGLWKEKQ